MKDLHERWPHRWRNVKTDSFESPIHGLGIRANQDILKGEIIIVYGGIIVPKSDIKEYRSLCGHAGIQISEDFFMVPPSRDELRAQGIVNHSCEPNLGFRSQVELIAVRDIKSGEEICLDYAFCETETETFKCGCGSATCRKTITAEDWRLSAIRSEYGEFFSPYLRARIVRK